MSGKWTPGPWWIVEKYADRNVFVRAEGGMIAEGPYPSHFSDQDVRFEEEKAEHFANARLISAAPDMAEALARCIEWIEADEAAHGRTFGCGNVARAALAKARGETS